MKWRATDLIDFEYFLRERVDTESAETAGDADRQIYQAFIKNHPETVHRSDLFRYWLSRKRDDLLQTADEQAVLPGKAAAETLGLARGVSGLAGFLLGAGLCGSLLAYAGKEPVNIFSCLWIMIAPQLVLLLLLVISSILRSLGPPKSVGGFYPLTTGLFKRSLKKLLRPRYQDLSAAKRMRIEAVIGMIGQGRTIYGRILFRPIFAIGQLFGIFFNVGIISVLLLRVAITDLAFGWQSTLQPAAETVYRLVDAIAFSWSWLVPKSVAHPTVSQIEGSQFVFKEGMRHLDRPDLAAWWPFLCLAVIFYGLLPRLLIFAGTLLRQQRAIKGLPFTHAACDRLLLSMKTPRVTTKSRAYKRPGDQGNEAADADAMLETKEAASTNTEHLESGIVLIPGDLAGQYEASDLAERLQLRLDLNLKTIITCGLDPDADSRAVGKNLEGDSGKAATRLVIIQEAWQPPIQETLSWISEIRTRSGIENSLIIGLIGKPGASTIFTPPADTDRMIWEHAIAKLGDPYIRVEILGE